MSVITEVPVLQAQIKYFCQECHTGDRACFFPLFFFFQFIYVVALGLPFCDLAFSSCSKREVLFGACASHCSGFSCCGAWALGFWAL